jgi:SAM-dependent methyltransferase
MMKPGAGKRTQDISPRQWEREKGLPSFTAVAEVYDHLMRSIPYRWWLTYVEEMLARFEKHPKTVMDLACGTGSLTLLLAEKGYAAVGVDNSFGMLSVAGRKAEKLGISVPFVLQDATSLSFRPAFNLVVSLFDSLNYIIGAERLRCAFQRISEACLPGATFMFDVNTIRALELELFTQNNLNTSDWLKYNWLSRYDPASRISTIQMNFTVSQDGQEFSFQEIHRQMGYELSEISGMLGDSGLRVLAVFDAYSTEKVHPLSTRAFFVTEKPGK